MVVGFVSCVLAGVLRAALLRSGPLVCKLVSNVLWRAVWLGDLSCYGSKKAALSSRPSWVVLPGRRSVSSSTAEWLHYRRRHSWVRCRAAVVFPALSLLEGVLLPFGRLLWWLYGFQAFLCRSLASLSRVQVLALLAGAAQLPVWHQHFVVAALAGPF